MLPYFRERVSYTAAFNSRQNGRQQSMGNKIPTTSEMTRPLGARRFRLSGQFYGRPLLPSLMWVTLLGLVLLCLPARHAIAFDAESTDETVMAETATGETATGETATAVSSPIVISEIHYKPEPSTEWIEFVELHNAGNSPVDLSGWWLDGGVRYLFPAGSNLEPDGYSGHRPECRCIQREIRHVGHGTVPGQTGQ